MTSWTRKILLAVLAVLAILPGGCGKKSSSTSSTPTVTVSPAASFLNLNGTQQFTATVTGVPTISIAASNGAVRAANNVTITTTAAHNLTVGQSVTIAGVTDATFNGTFTVTAVPTATTFNYSEAGIDSTSGGGTVTNDAVTWAVKSLTSDNSNLGSVTTGGLYTAPSTLPKAQTAAIAATGAVRKSSTVTITTSAAHSFVVGQAVLISGVTDSTFNGIFQILSVPSTTTFTYSQTANDASSGNGTVTAFAVSITATSVASTSTTATVTVSLQSGVGLTITPSNATVGTNETFQFTGNVTGTSGTALNWFVNNIPGGNSSVGTISATGLYTAPAVAPTQNSATIAPNNGAVRASNVVTITTVTAHGFQINQSVVIANVSDISFNGTFTITSVPSSSTFTYALTAADATSGGGTATSASDAVTVTAVSVLDPSKTADAGVQIVTAADPTLTSVTPSVVAQGALFQDVFLTGTNLISTTIVKVNGSPLSPTNIFQSSSSTLRARLPANFLAAPSSLSIEADRQNGAATAPQMVTVVTVRPALVGSSQDLGVQGGSAFTFNVDGGFFGPSNSNIQAEFNGNGPRALSPTANDTRQGGVTIGGADLATAGLFEVGIRNSTNPSLFAATNLAIRPSAAPVVLSPNAIAVGAQPSAIAISQSMGIAVVTNRCSNSISRIDVAGLTTVGSPIQVGAFPTGVAVDDVRNLAVVVNNGDNTGCGGSPGASSLSIVDLAAASVTSTVTTNLSGTPFSVGVNSLTGLALVTYQNRNHADILDLTQSPPAIVSTTTISTGGNPQVAVNPRLNWAVVTPGGAGTAAIVDLSRRVSASIAASGITRANGITFVTTTAAHTFTQNEVVLISGVTDSSFNGIFTIQSVPSSTSFTYVQSGAPNANSGGGAVVSTPAVALVSLGINNRGIAINPFTQRALLADPTSVNLTLFNLFDQVASGVGLSEVGAVAAAFSPFTDIAVTVNSSTNQASVIDPRVPSRLTTLPVGNGANAVAVDYSTDRAFVVNTNDGTVTPIDLGAIRALHISMLSLPLGRQFAPAMTLSSSTDMPVTIVGSGFVSGSLVRLNGVALPPPSSITGRQLTVTVPAAFLAAPSIYVLDVLNPSGEQSNVLNLSVVLPVDLTGVGGCATAPAPQGVAVDAQRNLAVVTNFGCSSVSLIDLNPATIGNLLATVAVGANPTGVAISSSLGLAVVANNGTGSAALVDLTASPPAVKSTVTVQSQPLGVAVDETSARAFVTNTGSASVSVVDLSAEVVTDSFAVEAFPEAIAVDPVSGFAAVASGNANFLDLVNLGTLAISNHVSAQLPTAVVFDPITSQFIVNSSLGNNLVVVNPVNAQSTTFRSGINPTSMAYSFASSTLVTVNTASSTFSVIDMVDRTIRDVLEIPGSTQFAVDIHPRSNLAVVADQTNNRVLLVPLPR